jgi:hypothetical protein
MNSKAYFTVVRSTSRKYGYSIKAPANVSWAKGPGNTFGWYKLKRDAQHRCDVLNQVKHSQNGEEIKHPSSRQRPNQR